jgi:hypothetical protein
VDTFTARRYSPHSLLLMCATDMLPAQNRQPFKQCMPCWMLSAHACRQASHTPTQTPLGSRGGTLLEAIDMCRNCLLAVACLSTCAGAHSNIAAAACSGACVQGCQDVCRCGRRACSHSAPGAGPPFWPEPMSCAVACRTLAAVWCLVSAAECILLFRQSKPADMRVVTCTWVCWHAFVNFGRTDVLQDPPGASTCVFIFVALLAGILRFCGDVPSGELPTPAVAVETAQKLLHQVGCSGQHSSSCRLAAGTTRCTSWC